MESVNAGKAGVFEAILGSPKAHCPVHTVSLDFLDAETTLATELGALAAFDSAKPSVFFAEGLIMYLGKDGKRKLLTDVSAVAAEGSVFILNFLHREGDDNTLGEAEATATLTELGWADLEFSKYGDERLNFGRFPTGKFEPSPAFSFVVCRKGSK